MHPRLLIIQGVPDKATAARAVDLFAAIAGTSLRITAEADEDDGAGGEQYYSLWASSADSRLDEQDLRDQVLGALVQYIAEQAQLGSSSRPPRRVRSRMLLRSRSAGSSRPAPAD